MLSPPRGCAPSRAGCGRGSRCVARWHVRARQARVAGSPSCALRPWAREVCTARVQAGRRQARPAPQARPPSSAPAVLRRRLARAPARARSSASGCRAAMPLLRQTALRRRLTLAGWYAVLRCRLAIPTGRAAARVPAPQAPPRRLAACCHCVSPRTRATHWAQARRRRSAGAVPGNTGRWAGGRRLARPLATSSSSCGSADGGGASERPAHHAKQCARAQRRIIILA